MKHLEEVVNQTLIEASNIYNRIFPSIPIRNDIKGKCAGQFCVKNGFKYLRFNPVLYKENKSTYDDTIVHEVAHYIVYEKFNGCCKPHGREWKSVMKKLGKRPDVTHKMDTANASTIRKGKTYTYECGCRTFEFSPIRHKRSTEQNPYICGKCKQAFIFKK